MSIRQRAQTIFQFLRSIYTTSEVLILISVVLFGASLTQSGFYDGHTSHECHPIPGFACFLFGWMVVNQGIVAWLANPALALAWYFAHFRSRRNEAYFCSLASFLLALSFLKYQFWSPPGFSMMGTLVQTNFITSYGIGYWLWLGSIAVSLTGCIIALGKPQTAG